MATLSSATSPRSCFFLPDHTLSFHFVDGFSLRGYFPFSSETLSSVPFRLLFPLLKDTERDILYLPVPVRQVYIFFAEILLPLPSPEAEGSKTVTFDVRGRERR